ncbi:MAG: RidA family protein [bacterium]|nr:RidA family protein [bacterium]
MAETVHTSKAPAAVGPYSQAVKVQCSSLVFCSGQVSIDPAKGELVGADAAEQCRQAMTNLGEVLIAAGADYSKVVKTTIFLTDMGDFAAVNEVYASFFESDPPARATFAVAGLPLGAKVEIEAVAAL